MIPANTKYDFVMPIGAECFVALNLDRLRLRTFSIPFDWAGGQPFNSLFAMFVKGFPNFLVQENLKLHLSILSGLHRGDAYLDTQTQFLFPHDFPTGVPLEKSFPVVKAKYDRRIARLHKKFLSAKRVLILHIETPISHLSRPTDADLVSAAAAAAAKYPNAAIDLLYIAHSPDMPSGKVTWKPLNERTLYASINVAAPTPKDVLYLNTSSIQAALRHVSLKNYWLHRTFTAFKIFQKRTARAIKCEKMRNGRLYTRILGFYFEKKSS